MKPSFHFLPAAVAALLCAGCRESEPKTSGPGGRGPGGPAVVAVTPAFRRDTPIELRTFGTVQPSMTAAIKPQVSGTLLTVGFAEGEEVRKGDTLFTIDPRPMEAELRQAEANLARDEVLLENARKEAQRQAELLEKGFASAELADQSKASAESLAAGVRAGQAAAENARLRLEYCAILAPFDGRTGRLLVHAGNLVRAGETSLCTVSRLKPVDVYFTLPQQDLPRVRARLAAGQAPAVRATAAGAPAAREGHLTFVDNAVDPATGTVQMKATFANEDEALWPGEFVDVGIVLEVQAGALLVPAAAVLTGRDGAFVFVVRKDETVENRPVRVSRTVGDSAVIEDGLAEGEAVVAEGQQRLIPGARVTIKAAAAAPAPKRP